LRPYCSCTAGYDGENCDIPDQGCLDYYLPNAVCNNPYDTCYDSSCVCDNSYIPVTPYYWEYDTNCSPTDATGCQNHTCYGNFECVDAKDGSGVQCQCPFDDYGRVECDRPRCNTDADCTAAGMVNVMCITATWYYVPAYCECQVGYTGELCNTPATCPNCGVEGACTNQGICECAPGYYGDYAVGNCTLYGDETQYCTTFDVVIGNVELAVSDILKALVNLAKIDRSMVNITGPTTTAYGHNKFGVMVCDTDDINHEDAGDMILALLHNDTDPTLDYYFVDAASTHNDAPSFFPTYSHTALLLLFYSLLFFLASIL